MHKKFLIPDWLYSARTDDTEIGYFEAAFYKNLKYYEKDVNESEARSNYAKRLGYFYLKHVSQRIQTLAKDIEIVEMGDQGFSWRFVSNLLNLNRPIYAICAGAGTNITFELALASRYPDSKILLLDPSPHAVRYVNNLNLPQAIEFIQTGLSNKKETLRFHKPDKVGSGSLSVLNLNPGGTFYELPVDSVGNIMADRSISREQLDILKFDIEGSEHDVVDDLIQQCIRPKQIMFEFDQPIPPWTMEVTLKKLCAYGYLVVSIWGLNVLLIDRTGLNYE